jgi:two-component system chemotaxis response regulator CheB
VIGGSAGAFAPLSAILAGLPADLPAPVLVAQHLHNTDRGLFAEQLDGVSTLPVTQAWDKTAMEAAHVYVAPANYHLLVEDRHTLALSIDPPVNYSRPSIDVLFESAARVWQRDLLGVLLSGASSDGVAGMRKIRELGGRNLAQAPNTATTPYMPQSAIDAGVVDEVLSPEAIGSRVQELATERPGRGNRGK